MNRETAVSLFILYCYYPQHTRRSTPQGKELDYTHRHLENRSNNSFLHFYLELREFCVSRIANAHIHAFRMANSDEREEWGNSKLIFPT